MGELALGKRRGALAGRPGSGHARARRHVPVLLPLFFMISSLLNHIPLHSQLFVLVVSLSHTRLSLSHTRLSLSLASLSSPLSNPNSIDTVLDILDTGARRPVRLKLRCFGTHDLLFMRVGWVRPVKVISRIGFRFPAPEEDRESLLDPGRQTVN